MHRAVYLNNQTLSDDREINNEAANRMLSAHREAKGSKPTDDGPGAPFSKSGVAPEASGSCDLRCLWHSENNIGTF
ncbi:MAG: hypothetical protein AAGH48_01880 [Pseudomonadota bacterium]